jgi:two-component system sensor histidine kinase YesM
VVHGIARKSEGGAIRIAIEATETDLLFSIADDGVGFEPVPARPVIHQGHSIGLSNIRARLAALYGSGCSPEIESAPGVGATVTFRIPAGGGNIRVTEG